MRSECTCILISDFTIDNLAGYLNNDKAVPKVRSIVSPYNQVVRVLKDENLECWKHNPDVAIVWIQPERFFESFRHILEFRNIRIENVFEEVDRFSLLLLNVCDRVKTVFIPIWVTPSYNRGFGMLDMKTGVGIENTLMRMNLRLSEKLGKASNIYLLNTRKWIEFAGKSAFNPKLWYMAKIPFGNQVFMEATRDLKSAFRGIAGNSKKLIILDLDDTLWGGTVGDVGWEKVRLGGHDPIGEAYADFQHSLKALKNRGILLGIVSKNEAEIALTAIDNHPDMILRRNDFAGWRINWNDKAQNIVDLVLELNLGLESVVFIDDNPVERARVRESLSEVLVPEWPEDKMQYKVALNNLDCFDTPTISNEDLLRTKSYRSEKERKELKKQVSSMDEWLANLKIVLKIEVLNEANLQRAVQLLNKTNQMNLRTRRISEAEIIRWTRQEANILWTVRVRDRYGDSGLTGILSMSCHGQVGKIVDFVLSCRVMGRKVEESMLYWACRYGKTAGMTEIAAEYFPTEKNKPCLKLFQSSGFVPENNSFVWKLDRDYHAQDYIFIEEGPENSNV